MELIFKTFQKINNIKKNNIKINLEKGKRNTNSFQIKSNLNNKSVSHCKKLKNSEKNTTLISKRKKFNEVNYFNNQNNTHNNSKFKITKVSLENKSNKDISITKKNDSRSKNGGSKAKKKKNLSGLQSKKSIIKNLTIMLKRKTNKNILQSPDGYKIK